MKFFVETAQGRTPLDISIDTLIIAGWAGRDAVAMEHHIQELEALGIKRPASTPIFYRVSASRLALTAVLQNPGPTSSGEVEYLLVKHAGVVYVGVASDHTDREVEKYGITVSKQMCDKPCADTLWRSDDVIAHWDKLELRSRIKTESGMQTYQSGPVSGLLNPQDLLQKLAAFEAFADGTAMFGGTLAAIGGIRPSDRFEYELHDPVLGRTISAGYDIVSLPLRG
jgi:hypothetical protein